MLSSDVDIASKMSAVVQIDLASNLNCYRKSDQDFLFKEKVVQSSHALEYEPVFSKDMSVECKQLSDQDMLV